MLPNSSYLEILDILKPVLPLDIFKNIMFVKLRHKQMSQQSFMKLKCFQDDVRSSTFEVIYMLTLLDDN